MFKKIIRFLWWLSVRASLLAMLALLLPKMFILIHAVTRTYTVDNVPAQRVAIVFGAGLYRDGTAGPVLRDRIETAVKLYQRNKADKLLMSGDNRFANYNEPEAMRQYALELGVPDKDIVLDYAGRRTYDTCYRANAIFDVKSAILVTQAFHMPRALFLCNSLGVESVGVESNNVYFLKRSRLIWQTRELFATLQSVLDVYILRPLPVLGNPEPIRFE
jgi:SanA protein